MNQNNHSAMQSKKLALRSELHKKRQQVSSKDRSIANKNIMRCIRKLPIYCASKHVGVYLSSPSEVCTEQLISQNNLWQKTSYLPVITSLRNSRMRFAKVNPDTHFRKNSLGIIEPIVMKSELHSALSLDVIFIPLLGFDVNCNRLGMGKGYYDRFLQHRLSAEKFKKPILIGLAFAEQQVDHIPINQWDVPLDTIITSASKVIWKSKL